MWEKERQNLLDYLFLLPHWIHSISICAIKESDVYRDSFVFRKRYDFHSFICRASTMRCSMFGHCSANEHQTERWVAILPDQWQYGWSYLQLEIRHVWSARLSMNEMVRKSLGRESKNDQLFFVLSRDNFKSSMPVIAVAIGHWHNTWCGMAKNMKSVRDLCLTSFVLPNLDSTGVRRMP